MDDLADILNTRQDKLPRRLEQASPLHRPIVNHAFAEPCLIRYLDTARGVHFHNTLDFSFIGSIRPTFLRSMIEMEATL